MAVLQVASLSLNVLHLQGAGRSATNAYHECGLLSETMYELRHRSEEA